MKFLVADYPGLIVTDLDKPGVELRHIVWVDKATGEYAQWDCHRDGAVRLTPDGSAQTVTHKGRLFLNWLGCANVPEWA
jgi:hypothetical protein